MPQSHRCVPCMCVCVRVCLWHTYSLPLHCAYSLSVSLTLPLFCSLLGLRQLYDNATWRMLSCQLCLMCCAFHSIFCLFSFSFFFFLFLFLLHLWHRPKRVEKEEEKHNMHTHTRKPKEHYRNCCELAKCTTRCVLDQLLRIRPAKLDPCTELGAIKDNRAVAKRVWTLAEWVYWKQSKINYKVLQVI